MSTGTSKTKRLAAMNRAFGELRRPVAAQNPKAPPAEAGRAKERKGGGLKPPATARLSSLVDLGAAWRARQKGLADG